MDDKDKLDQIGRAMMAAWQRVKKAQTRMWGDWMVIGDGLLEGRRWAMQMAGTNQPEGKGYVTAFGEWLKRYRVDDMDKSDRAKLLQLMEERPAVEEWRATLPDYERRSLNNPIIVWRKWTAATRVKKPKQRTAGVSASEHGRAQAMIEQLQARIGEVEEENSSLKEELAAAAVEKEESAAPVKDEPVQFPQYFRSAPGAHDITAKQIADWLEQELLADRISPLSLDLIGKNAVTLAYRYWAKGGKKRRAKPNMDLSWRSRAPGD
jgi:hypothetical protein